MRAHDVAVREIRATLKRLAPVAAEYETAQRALETFEEANELGASIGRERLQKAATRFENADAASKELMREIHRVVRLYPKAWAAAIRLDSYPPHARPFVQQVELGVSRVRA